MMTDSTSVTSVHPPLSSLKISTPEGEVTATPFRKGREGADPANIDDIRKIYHQNNYSNQILHTIATQIDSLSTKLDSLPKSSPRFPQDISNPHFMTRSLPREKEANMSLTSENLLNRISQSLSSIPSTSKGITCLEKGCLANINSESDSSVSDEEEETHEIITTLENAFNDDPVPSELNKIHHKNLKNIFKTTLGITTQSRHPLIFNTKKGVIFVPIAIVAKLYMNKI